MTDEATPPKADFVPEADHFWVGEEDLLAPALTALGAKAQSQSEGASERSLAGALADIRIRVGTLLKAETVSFLLGAGASVECGGQLIGSVPLMVERALLDEGIAGDARSWLTVFYLAVRCAGGGEGVPVDRTAILQRREELAGESPGPLQANFEQVLGLLYRWRSALPANGGRLRVDGSTSVDVKAEDLDVCLAHATRALARSCDLPTDRKADGLATLKMLLRKLLTRPLKLKRVNVFTLNYDTLVEQASDAEGIVLLDGFVGTQRRIFRPESYEQDLYFPAETTEGRVHRFDRVLHLYKLHGSITWVADQPTIDNPYGVLSTAFDPNGTQPLLIYPTPAKFGAVSAVRDSAGAAPVSAVCCRLRLRRRARERHHQAGPRRSELHPGRGRSRAHERVRGEAAPAEGPSCLDRRGAQTREALRVRRGSPSGPSGRRDPQEGAGHPPRSGAERSCGGGCSGWRLTSRSGAWSPSTRRRSASS